jgi:hypothetical protein
MEPAERIAELETELKRRGDKIKELTTDRDEAQELVNRMREHVEDADRLIEQWIEAFDMHPDRDGVYQFAKSYSGFFETYEQLIEENRKLVREWNKFIPEYNAEIRPRERGRPLAASATQQTEVIKRRKAGQTLRVIATATGLGLRTVCTIVDKPNRRDRSGKRTNLLRRQAFDRHRAADYRAKKRLRDTLPQKIGEQLKTGAMLVKAAKGIGQ